MTQKIKHSLLAIAAILILCGCENKPKQKVNSINRDSKLGTVWIDTIQIHGKDHEILVRNKNFGRGGIGGMMHSPECWCGKGGGR